MNISVEKFISMQLVIKNEPGSLILVIVRNDDDGIQTLGDLYLYDGANVIYNCKTLELPWKNNSHNISCIPEGIYGLKKYSSSKHPKNYEVAGVPNRDAILIHKGNYNTDIQGCILVGDGYNDINNDGEIDIINSSITVEKLLESTNYEELPIVITYRV